MSSHGWNGKEIKGHLERGNKAKNNIEMREKSIKKVRMEGREVEG